MREASNPETLLEALKMGSQSVNTIAQSPARFVTAAKFRFRVHYGLLGLYFFLPCTMQIYQQAGKGDFFSFNYIKKSQDSPSELHTALHRLPKKAHFKKDVVKLVQRCMRLL